MKRNISKIIKGSVALVLIGVAGCNKQLEQLPQSQLSDNSFWHTTSDLGQACNYLYTFLPGLGSTPTGNPTPYQDNYSNDAWGSGSSGIGDGSRVAPATSSEWSNYYTLIRAANNVLEKSTGVTGDAAIISKYLGEAKFFRAYAYFELVKRFGDVPYINRTLTLTDTALYAHRTNREVVVDSIYADLDFAAANCPQPDAQAAAEYGRITATAALGFKSRVALFEGTWNKYHGSGDAARHLQAAIDASDAVIKGGKHSLYTASGDSSYYYEFQYNGSAGGNPIQITYGPQVNYTYATNKENLLVRLYGQNLANNIASHSYERGSLEQGAITATRSFMDAYLYSDGLPQGKSTYDSSKNPTGTLTEFRNRDPRIGMTVFNKTVYFPSLGGIFLFTPGTSYKIRKYFVISDWNGQTSFINFNAMRYAEVLLNNAEAKFELNGMISDDDLNVTINVIRNRASNNNTAKLPSLTNAFVTTNGLSMLAEIRRERRVELAFEGFHYWDILRWKTAETDLKQSVLGPKFFAAESPGVTPPSMTPDGFTILSDASKRNFDPARDYLWPLPTKELALSTNLAQNPNW